MANSVATTTGTLTALMKTYYDKLLLEVARPKMVLDQFADKSRDIPRHEGQTVSFQRFVPLEVVTATTNEGELPPYVELEAMRFEATLQKYANAVKITEEVELTALSPVLEAAVKELGENMGQSLNRLYRGALAKFLYPMRVDNSATYGKSCVATAGTTTTLTDATNLSEAADFWNGGTVVITSGQNKGYSAHIDDFASGVITFSPALKEACDAGDTFRVVTSTGITSTNVITCSAVERAVALLKYFNAPTYDGKYYIGIISPFVQYDFMQDSAWVNAHHYAQDTALFDGEVGRWGGVRWVEDTDPWLEAAGTIGTYNANGAVHQTPIFGRHAYAGVGLEGVPDKLFIKKPGDQDTSNYINAYSMVAWRVYFVPVVLNALFGVTLISGASTIA
ncbi:MAG TPA: N4-gp56 family major capsid protein [Thermodesulfovibrio thiophilus]|nr:N4-gp56 family major capsid protein [Thermodesulfovibrio thiophilus]